MVVKKRSVIIVGTVAALVGASVLGLWALVAYRQDARHKYRKEWKDKAVAEIGQLADDADWRAAETARLKSQPARSLPGGETWLSERLVVLENGDWMVYASKASKSDPRINDIFICKASDGKWYHSTRIRR